ncbi:MAG TPA: hypothetical protein VMS35_01985 [Nitrososphaeraceae archaeon]|nr:hypothetical protein [Nitrososphaeraceae archaeon]
MKNQNQRTGFRWKMNENGMIIYMDVAGKSIVALELFRIAISPMKCTLNTI